MRKQIRVAMISGTLGVLGTLSAHFMENLLSSSHPSSELGESTVDVLVCSGRFNCQFRYDTNPEVKSRFLCGGRVRNAASLGSGRMEIGKVIAVEGDEGGVVFGRIQLRRCSHGNGDRRSDALESLRGCPEPCSILEIEGRAIDGRSHVLLVRLKLPKSRA